jgi:CBS domain containing-hemolysin-like protein
MNWPTWIGIAFCLSHSAIFSGLNLAIFSVGRLRLEVEARAGNLKARKVLAFRKDANFALTTILWGNVAINVLLTLLSTSVLSGLASFVFSTVVITFIGEIFPQAFFSRYALVVASRFAPLLRFYQILLFPIAKPTALLLNALLGPEGVTYFREKDLEELIRAHMGTTVTEVSRVEGMGAINFLRLDDVAIAQEGEIVDPDSILQFPFEKDRPIFPLFQETDREAFLNRLARSGKKWLVLTDPEDQPRLMLDADSFLRAALFANGEINPLPHCHRPIIRTDSTALLGEVMRQLTVHPERAGDDVIDHDVILLWGPERRIITGADILGRLMRGIVRHL